MILRDYQKDAVAAVYAHLRSKATNPVVVIPTGGGKTPCIATICRDAVLKWHGRVIVLSHVKELLEQSARHLIELEPSLASRVGVYSAGLGSKDAGRDITVAGIQSVYKADLGSYNLAIIDEAHLIPPEGEGMYRTFLQRAREINPKIRMIGMTATPFRMKSGTICSDDSIFQEICYEVGIRQLIADGYLCKLTAFAGAGAPDTSGLHVRAGEFIPGEVDLLMNQEKLVAAAVADMRERTKDRKAVLVFASSIAHAENVAAKLAEAGEVVRAVFGGTNAEDRARAVADFRAGRLKFLVNCAVFTTGFDAPNVDTVALLRPTMSPGLMYQMCGRGFRVCAGKDNCLVLDYGGNVVRHGPIDAIKAPGQARDGKGGEAPAKECPECHALIATAYRTCPNCGHEFPAPQPKHDPRAANVAILSDQQTVAETYSVKAVTYKVWEKMGATDKPPTMRVTYQCALDLWFSEWVCFEHDGYARRKAESWWRERTDYPVPDAVADAVDHARAGMLREPFTITVAKNPAEKFPRIIGYSWPEDEFEEAGKPTAEEGYEDVPF